MLVTQLILSFLEGFEEDCICINEESKFKVGKFFVTKDRDDPNFVESRLNFMGYRPHQKRIEIIDYGLVIQLYNDL